MLARLSSPVAHRGHITVTGLKRRMRGYPERCSDTSQRVNYIRAPKGVVVAGIKIENFGLEYDERDCDLFLDFDISEYVLIFYLRLQNQSQISVSLLGFLVLGFQIKLEIHFPSLLIGWK
ncbi:hypothetical protein AAHA92_16988 [Salvia divinorum]|uniref:Uncharacterized protein n=1 Tax=Salvia divinorum TaxID=28513 RepID=A0ABD1H1D7_SALDI